MVREKLLAWRAQVNDLILERMAEVNGLLLALLTRQHVVLVGPGGTGKSLVGRLLNHAIDGARFWDYQFNKYSLPEDVFGPPSIKALQEGVFRRVTANRLPEAHFALADEVFEANASILNALRKVLNERLYENDGGNQTVPLEVMIGATNLLPAEESLAALYDRFLLRFHVRYIAEPSHFLAMLKGPKRFGDFAARVTARMSLDEIHQAQDEVRAVTVPDAVLEGMYSIRSALAGQGIVPSDRRWNESIGLVQAKAWLQGRTEAIMDDLGVLTDVLWTDPNTRQLVVKVVLETSNPLLKKAEEQHDAFQVAWANLGKVQEDKEKMMVAVETLAKVNKALKALEKIKTEGEQGAMDMSTVDTYIAAGERIQEVIQRDYLDLRPREAKSKGA